MTDSIERYPLAWPPGWRRTPARARRRATFATTRGGRAIPGVPESERRLPRPLTLADGLARLVAELDRLGARAEVLSTNMPLRLDGLPRSGMAEPEDPGAAVYFRLQGADRCLACDKWDRVADNIAALAAHIDALRRIDRYGVGSMAQAFAGYAALRAAPPSPDWWDLLEVPQDAPADVIESAFRAKAKLAHPDVPGGSHDAMAALTVARAAGLEACSRTP